MTASPRLPFPAGGGFFAPGRGRARLVACLTLPLWCPAGGACLLCRLLPPAFSLLSCPLSPRPPSPAGKGVPQSLFRRGLRPRHPCAEPLAALTEPSSAVPSGGVPGWSAADLAAAVPGGGRACFVACYLPPLACFPAPYPPSPRSQSDLPRRHLLSLPRGRGPSQTPKFLSPGPPSPWLPSLLKGKRFLPFLRRTIGSAPGMQGAKPLA